MVRFVFWKKPGRALLDICGSIAYSFQRLAFTEVTRDAGIALSCQIDAFLQASITLAQAMQRPPFRVLELGTGCGMVGISIARITEGATIILTDLPEAREIVDRNIAQAQMARGTSLSFQELDWDAELPANLQSTSSPLDLVVATDCTYNPDSRYAVHHLIAKLETIAN